MLIDKLIQIENKLFLKIILDKLGLKYVLSLLDPGDKRLAQHMQDLRYLKLKGCNKDVSLYLENINDLRGLNLIEYNGWGDIYLFELNLLIDFSTLNLTGYTGKYRIFLQDNKFNLILEINKDNYLEMIKKYNFRYDK